MYAIRNMPERESFSESAVLHVPLLLRTTFSYTFTIIAFFRSIYCIGTSLLAVHHRLHWRTPIVLEITTVTGTLTNKHNFAPQTPHLARPMLLLHHDLVLLLGNSIRESVRYLRPLISEGTPYDENTILTQPLSMSQATSFDPSSEVE